MEFDKSRVYTALNAEDLPIGSKCIFADTLKKLKEGICENHIDTLFGITDEHYSCRFVSDNGRKRQFALAYLIELPAEPKYKPFSSSGKALEVIKAHDGWIKEKETEEFCFITFIGSDSNILVVSTNNGLYTSDALLACFVFADDSSPCGELVEG